MFTIYTQDRCNFCIRAKMLLDSKGEPYEDININENQDAKEKLKELGLKTVPQIWLKEEHIGGYIELKKKYV